MLMLASAQKSNLKGGVLIAQVAGGSFTAVREDCGNCAESEETASGFKRMEVFPDDAGRRSQLVCSQAEKTSPGRWEVLEGDQRGDFETL